MRRYVPEVSIFQWVIVFVYFRGNKNRPRNKLNSVRDSRNFLSSDLFLYVFGGRGWMGGGGGWWDPQIGKWNMIRF